MEVFHKSIEAKEVEGMMYLQATPDTLMIIKILLLEHPKTQLTIYKNNFLIKCRADNKSSNNSGKWATFQNQDNKSCKKEKSKKDLSKAIRASIK